VVAQEKVPGALTMWDAKLQANLGVGLFLREVAKVVGYEGPLTKQLSICRGTCHKWLIDHTFQWNIPIVDPPADLTIHHC